MTIKTFLKLNYNQNIIDNIHKKKFVLVKNKLKIKKNSNFDVISVFKFNSIRSIINNFLFKRQRFFRENFQNFRLFKSETKNKE